MNQRGLCMVAGLISGLIGVWVVALPTSPVVRSAATVPTGSQPNVYAGPGEVATPVAVINHQDAEWNPYETALLNGQWPASPSGSGWSYYFDTSRQLWIGTHDTIGSTGSGVDDVVEQANAPETDNPSDGER